MPFFSDACFVEDMGWPGNEIGTAPITVDDPASCQKECQKNDECQVWSFNSGSGACWLKTEKASESPGGGRTSGPKFCPG